MDEELKIFLGKRKQKKGQGGSHLWKAAGGSHMMEKRWGQVFAQAQLGFWWGLFPVRPGKCGPQLSRVIKATTCSSLKASLCFLAPSSCSSAHTICPSEVKRHDTRRPQSALKSDGTGRIYGTAVLWLKCVILLKIRSNTFGTLWLFCLKLQWR